MLSRIFVVIIGVPIVFALTVLGSLPRLFFFSIVSLLGQKEFYNMFGDKNDSSHRLLEYTCGLFILFATFTWLDKGLLLGFAFSAIILAIAVVVRGLNGNGYKRFALGTVSLLYIPFCLGFFLLIAQIKSGLLVFAILAAIWALDIGAYGFGMTLRGLRLAPKISPNKTVSGAIGGTITCLLFVYSLHYFKILEMPLGRSLSFGVAIAVIGQISDLFESVLKREAGVKDSGALLGAHGGVLDRIDSLLLLGPISYFYSVILG